MLFAFDIRVCVRVGNVCLTLVYLTVYRLLISVWTDTTSDGDERSHAKLQMG